MRIPHFTKYLMFTAALGTFSLTACEDFLDINQSPNSVLTPPTNNLLVAAESDLGFLMGSDVHRYSSIFVQQFAGQGGLVQTVDYDRYTVTATDMNNLWRTSIYADAQADMKKLIEQTQATSPKYAGIAKIMQAFLFTVTTDAFGDIPFSQALQFEAQLQPAYDKSEDVYTGLITLINSGIDDIKKQSTLTPGSDDLLYGGDMLKWEKLANALKLRIYIHYYPKISATATTNINTLLTSGAPLMTSTADNFQMVFQALSNRTNPIDQFEPRRQNQFFPSATLVDLMNSKADPRRATYFTEFPAGQYTGVVNGTGTVVSTSFSRMHTYLRGARTGTGVQDYAGDAPIRMLTFAEQNLILAEFYQRTGNTAQATKFLTDGVQASLSMASVPAANATTYLATLPAQIAAKGLLRTIIEEKFIANYGVAVEPWSDWRRTKFPAITPSVGATLPAIPRILPYSDLERVTNPNTPARSSSDLTKPQVFWDPGA
ncbi:SusD/RagB family nutrient-binding outer membrane lipoprotein [Hymenobacter sp. 102]|uniref:SusD/RagB family nutrient-binding outer membrane lipoprotein n=1 Tax=Hymenobacter sp. 102 TaxID=3403152 RepID=UPI003CFB8558